MQRLSSRTRTPECASDLVLDQLVGGELSRDETRDLRRHIDGCSRCEQRLSTIEADARAFAERPVPPLVLEAANASQDAVARPPNRRRRWLGYAAPAAAAAVLVWLLRAPGGLDPEPVAPVARQPVPENDAEQGRHVTVPFEVSPLPERPEPARRSTTKPRASAAHRGDASQPRTTRTKGGAVLRHYVERDGGVRPGASVDPLHPGDRVRFAYTSRAPGYLVVLGHDAAGVVSLYHPVNPTVVPRVEPGRERLLPSSVVLDDVLGEERIYGVLCLDEVEPEALKRTLEQNPEHPAWPRHCEASVLTLHKRAR